METNKAFRTWQHNGCTYNRAEFHQGIDTLVAIYRSSDRQIELYWVDPSDGIEMYLGLVPLGSRMRMHVSARVRTMPLNVASINYRDHRQAF